MIEIDRMQLMAMLVLMLTIGTFLGYEIMALKRTIKERKKEKKNGKEN